MNTKKRKLLGILQLILVLILLAIPVFGENNREPINFWERITGWFEKFTGWQTSGDNLVRNAPLIKIISPPELSFSLNDEDCIYAQEFYHCTINPGISVEDQKVKVKFKVRNDGSFYSGSLDVKFLTPENLLGVKRYNVELVQGEVKELTVEVPLTGLFELPAEGEGRDYIVRLLVIDDWEKKQVGEELFSDVEAFLVKLARPLFGESFCNNQVKEEGEVCDGVDLGGESCESVGSFTGGVLKCSSTCQSFDKSYCAVSGRVYLTISEGEVASIVFSNEGQNENTYYVIFDSDTSGDVSEDNYDSKISPGYTTGMLRRRYNDVGVYTAQVLKVTPNGERELTSFIITVNNVAPTAVLYPKVPAIPERNYDNILVGETVLFEDGGSFAAPKDKLSFYWDFDDSDGLSFEPDLENADAIGNSVEYVYETPGDYVVTLRVVDEEGSSSDATLTVKVKQKVREESVPVCGNNIKEEGEECDEGENNSDEPNAVCRTDCKLRKCGDNIIDYEFGEVCDSDNLGLTCDDFEGFKGGELSCASNCKEFDTSGCLVEEIPGCQSNVDCDEGFVCDISKGVCVQETLITCENLDTNPALDLSFDEGSAIPGVVGGNPGIIAGGVSNEMFDFDGVDDYVQLSVNPVSSEPDKFTYSFWIYPRNVGPPKINMLIDAYRDHGNTYGYGMSLEEGVILSKTSKPILHLHYPLTEQGMPLLQPNKWYHVVFTYDKTTKESKLYFNGELVREGISQNLITQAVNPRIAGQIKSYKRRERYYDGLMDEFEMYNKLVNPDRIKAYYEQCKPSPPLTNSPPEFVTEELPVGNLGSEYIASIVTKDEEADDLSLTFRNAPEGLIIDSSSKNGKETTFIIKWTKDKVIGGTHTFTAELSDGKVTVNKDYNFKINQPPSITTTSLPTASIGIDYSVTNAIIEATDPENDELTYKIIERAEELDWLVLNTANGVLSGMPTIEGSFSFTVKVEDEYGLTAEKSFTLTVIQPNRPPEIEEIPDQTITQNEYYTYQVIATDPDGDSITYSISGQPNNVEINSNTGLITGTPIQQGTFIVTVTANDQQPENNIDTEEFVLTINPVINTPPVITSTPVTDAVEAHLYNYDVEASDAEGDDLFFSLEIAPANMNIDATTGLITWTPSSEQVGTVTVKVIVTDVKGASSEQSFEINVKPNSPPEFVTEILPAAVEDEEYKSLIEAIDVDGDKVIFEVVDNPYDDGRIRIADEDVEDNKATLVWSKPLQQDVDNSPVSVSIKIDDGKGTESSVTIKTFELTVQNVNDAPVIESIPDQTITQGESYSYQVVVNDEDDTSWFFSITGQPEGIIIDQNTGLISGIPSEQGSFTIIITVNDGHETNNIGTEEFILTVNPAVEPPACTPEDECRQDSDCTPQEGKIGICYQCTCQYCQECTEITSCPSCEQAQKPELTCTQKVIFGKPTTHDFENNNYKIIQPLLSNYENEEFVMIKWTAYNENYELISSFATTQTLKPGEQFIQTDNFGSWNPRKQIIETIAIDKKGNTIGYRIDLINVK